MPVISVKIKTDPQLVDTLCDFLVGVMGMTVEYGVDDNASDTTVQGFFVSDRLFETETIFLIEKIADFSREMAGIFSLPVPEITTEEVHEQDWSAKWKQFFKPFELIPGLIIAPTWERYTPVSDEKVIVMDPGMAFGTGHHATTKLCLKMIASSSDLFSRKDVLDVGTGTGILAMAAAMWGASGVSGIDNDHDAVKVAGENVAGNNLGETVHISATDLSDVRQQFELVVANIIHNVLVELADDLARVVAVNGILIVSGLVYGEQTVNIINCFEQKGLRLLEEQQEGEWGAIKFQKG